MTTKSTSTYIELVNSAINEAGLTLASFAADGSDWLTNTDPMMNRFKTWVTRAWREIQQDSFDLEFMSEQAVVNINPGIMFFSQYTPYDKEDVSIPASFFDTDGTPIVPTQIATAVRNLTGDFTRDKPFGYINLDCSADNPINILIKAGGTTFTLDDTDFTVTLESRNGALSRFGPLPSNNDYLVQMNAYGYDSLNNIIKTIQIGNGAETLKHIAKGGAPFPSDFFGTIVNSLDTYNLVGKITQNAGQFMQELQDILTSPAYVSVNVTMSTANPANLNTGTVTGGRLVSSQSYTDKVNFAAVSGNIQQAAPVNVSFYGPTTSLARAPGTKIAQIVISNTAAGVYDGTYANNGNIISAGDLENTNPLLYTRFTVNITNTSLAAIFYQLAQDNTASFYATLYDTNGDQAGLVRNNVLNNSEWGGTFYPTVSGNSGKNVVHSWKSYDWDEETGLDDFVEYMREVDNDSFILVDNNTPSNSVDVPLKYVPWEAFVQNYNFVNVKPARPIYITEDNTGRWRMYPPPDRPYTLMFDYVRESLDMMAYNDTPKGIPQEYVDMIMWRAVWFFGEYDEQPNVAARAKAQYYNMLMRFEQQLRPKFHFKSAFKNL